MKETYTVHFSDGSNREFKVRSVIDAWIRGMGLIAVIDKDMEVTHIVNNRSMRIWSDFEWNLEFSIQDTALITGSQIKYTESEVRELMKGYVRYVGNSWTHFIDWWDRNKKRV